MPGYTISNGNATATCAGGPYAVGCSGSESGTTVNMPPRWMSNNVRGATFTLLLPDGRMTVVNCESKFAEHFAGRAGNRRSCRMPLVDDIEAEFSGDKAKLKWSVSLDGKTTESETYKILAVLPK